MPEQPALLASAPGIKRDGTRFDSEHYLDGQWCRFQRGKPKKIGGYQQVTDTVPEITRGIASFSADDIQYLHLGHPNTIGQYQVSNGSLNLFSDRTPAGFNADLNNLWQFDIFADTGGTGNHLLMAHVAENAANIDNSVNGTLYIDTVDATTILNTTGLHADYNASEATSGGVVVSGVFTWTYGSKGLILQSQPNNLTLAPVAINIGTQKIVKGMPLRGAGQGPAALFWGLDILIRATFIPGGGGGQPDFAYDVIARGMTIMSSQGVIEMDGIYYWPGVDRWYMFNGVVREVPNNLNQNWFFDNINFRERQKCFGMKIPRYGELWWCYPRGNATECTHAVVYNVREGYWFDTALPDSDDLNQGRCAGIYADVYQRPFMVDNEIVSGAGRTLWQHETAFDKIRLSNISAVRASFETHEFALLDQGDANKSLRVARIEPDFVQAGDMTVQVKGRANAKASVVTSDPETIFATPSASDEETVKFKDIRRLMSFKFESNTGGGNFEQGKTYAHIEPADGRVES
jgi:hypothetical protein